MIRYLMFGFDDYYPGGGWNDFLGTFVDGSDIEDVKLEAMRLAVEKRHDYVQVADLKTGKILWEVST